ncbi:hypothetical protein AVEN_136379-1 [Araneus ventricosus]|uniref:Uncharacterized protein n=1 Tax=Araneus ventricosus TaxID=182803 RepID=A0A4Y2KFB2_ARAVE|nr:hypothetical protein AVEN_136379-1 [Araneus ventricosus]
MEDRIGGGERARLLRETTIVREETLTHEARPFGSSAEYCPFEKVRLESEMDSKSRVRSKLEPAAAYKTMEQDHYRS